MPRIACSPGTRGETLSSTTPPAIRQEHAETDRLCRLLVHVPLLSGFSPAEIARFAHGVREQNVDRGCVVFHKGDPCHGFHLVLAGQV